ncbi:MAG: hypothetical protein MJ099_00875 [Clostridia bacterium]|nr:hypothetical protein [Clostridia bacterium]
MVYDYYIKGDTNVFRNNTTIMDMWVLLIERYPERFMIGSDKVGHFAAYPAEILKYYSLLDRLKPETREKICRKNIESLLNRK